MNDNIQPRGVYKALLPPTPCKPEMSNAIRDVATQRNTSVAEIQRAAFAFFLANVDRISTTDVGNQNSEGTE